MVFVGNKNILNKFIVSLFMIIGGSVLFINWQMSGGKDLNVEKIVLKYEENDAFSLAAYSDCLYEINTDISNKCIESEVRSLIERDEASEVLHLIKALDGNKEKYSVNCQYLAERIGKVFNNITDLESLLLIDFAYCNYGFQLGVFGEIDEDFLEDKNMLALIKQSCSKYIIEYANKDNESGACHKGIANILTSASSKIGPLESSEFCLAIEDPEGVCLNNLLKNYLGKSSSKLSKELFADKERVVETLLNFCNKGGVDKTKYCLTDVIANIFAHNEKLVYLVADYCSKVALDISKSCYREIANGFNLAIQSAQIKENSNPALTAEAMNQEGFDKLVDKTQIFKIFRDNQPKYCNFLEDVVGLDKKYVDQCFIGFSLVLLEYYEIDEKELCKYFNKKMYDLCKVGIKINNGKSIDAKYRVG